MTKKKIIFTEQAKKQIVKLTSTDNSKKFFCISVKGGGCSGFKYNFSVDNKSNHDDILFENTIIDKKSLEIIDGSTIDFKIEI